MNERLQREAMRARRLMLRRFYVHYIGNALLSKRYHVCQQETKRYVIGARQCAKPRLARSNPGSVAQLRVRDALLKKVCIARAAPAMLLLNVPV